MGILEDIMGPRPNPTGMTPQEQVQGVAGSRMMPAPITRGTPSFIAGRDAPSPQMAPPAPAKPSFGQKISNFFSDEDKVAKLILALEPLRGPGGQGGTAAKWAQSHLQTSRETNLLKAQANQTIAKLRQMKRDDLADAVEANPSLALDALKAAFNVGGASSKAFAPRIDSEGNEYIVRYDPATGAVEKIPTGATGLTETERLDLESESALKVADVEEARKRGATVYSRVGAIDDQIYNLNRVIQQLDEGAETGIIRDYLPAFDAATAELRSTANLLGIDVINMATFGALSEKELQLALSTGLPRGLSPAQTRAWAASKVEAQRKLRNALFAEAKTLSSGIGYSQWITDFGGQSVYERGSEPASQTQATQPTPEKPTMVYDPKTRTLIPAGS